MWISKKTAALYITYSLAAVAVLGAFTVIGANGASEGYGTASRNAYWNAFTEFSQSMEDLTNSLDRAKYASSPSMITAACTEAYANAVSARTALGALPYSNIELEHTAAFVSKAGDYAAYLAHSAAGGRSYTQEERENVAALAKSAALLSATISRLDSYLVSGEISDGRLEALDNAVSMAEDSMVDTGFASSFKKMEAEFPELPTLIYDGPFSEHITSLRPRLLEGEREIDEREAVRAASKFTGLSENAFRVEYPRESDVPVWVVTTHTLRGPMTLEVTKTGGHVMYYLNHREVAERRKSVRDALETAEEFLRSQGIYSMETTYYTLQGNTLLISFAYNDGGVICYPDLVKVAVAMDNGEIVGYESLGYIMRHGERELGDLKISEDAAIKKLSPLLTVLSTRPAVIPTSGQNEIFCLEFKCEDEDGRHCLVYVNGETGAEEKILILLEDENGTLVI